MMTTTLLKVDLKDFNAQAQKQDATDTAKYLMGYYDKINTLVRERDWKVIKTIGDCVLINTDQPLHNNVISKIDSFYDNIKTQYALKLHFRQCMVETQEVKTKSYQCQDVFGKDVNNLFLEDKDTHVRE